MQKVVGSTPIGRFGGTGSALRLAAAVQFSPAERDRSIRSPRARQPRFLLRVTASQSAPTRCCDTGKRPNK